MTRRCISVDGAIVQWDSKDDPTPKDLAAIQEIIAAAKAKFAADRAAGIPIPMVCRGCGCTETRACLTEGVPCHWVSPRWCSACDDKQHTADLQTDYYQDLKESQWPN